MDSYTVAYKNRSGVTAPHLIEGAFTSKNTEGSTDALEKYPASLTCRRKVGLKGRTGL